MFGYLFYHIIIEAGLRQKFLFFCVENLHADIQHLMGTDMSGLRRKSALCILKMKEKIFLSQAAIDDMVEETCSVVTSALGMVNASIRGKLADAGVDLTSIDLLSQYFLMSQNHLVN